MSTLKLVKAFRTDENTVKVMYFHNDRKQEFVIEWNNIHPETGEMVDYDLQIGCLSNSENLNSIVEDAIGKGETEDCDLYLEMRDIFDKYDCERIKEK
jgi:hypothetical protein